jgi:hypothetical protein
VAVGGGALGTLAGGLLDLAVPCAIVGALNGAISGWRRIYWWSSPSGWVGFALDSSWALVTTAAGLAVHAIAGARHTPGDFRPELSERAGRHVYARGVTARRGFLLTVGNVVSGAAGPLPRTRRIVDEHEQVHVWQARWFGPLFPLLYGGWLVAGALAGTGVWLARRGQTLPGTIEAWAYYRNPFEWWAYRREGRWPPARRRDVAAITGPRVRR